LPIKYKDHSRKQSLLSSEVNDLVSSLKSYRKDRFVFWENVVGEKIAKVAFPVKDKKGVLFVKVEDSIWRFELARRKEELIDKINEHLKKNSIKDIVFI
jgi:predicted nucleic acid-binding Zn ribbon protein